MIEQVDRLDAAEDPRDPPTLLRYGVRAGSRLEAAQG